MKAAKKEGHIEKFLKKADKALQEGIKKADEVLDDAVEFGAMTAKQATKKSKDLRNQAKKERDLLQKRGISKINEGISAAKNVTSNTQDDLEILKKLGKLRKSEIITEKEFQSKKKKILDRIQNGKTNIFGTGNKRTVNPNWFTNKTWMKVFSDKIKSKDQDMHHVHFEKGSRTNF